LFNEPKDILIKKLKELREEREKKNESK